MSSGSRQLLVLLSGLVVTWADAAQANEGEIAKSEIRVIVEQYQAVLAGHAEIDCAYTFKCGDGATLEDALAKRWIPNSAEYASEGIYKSKGGKVFASEYSTDTPVDLGNNTQRGGITRYLTNAEWRTLHTPDFHLMSVGHRGTFKNDRWGPSFTPWSLGVMGGTLHLPGTENLGVYNHFIDNLETSAVSAHASQVRVPGRASEEAAICISVTSGKGTGTRNYYFTTPEPYSVPLLTKFELFNKDSTVPHTVAYVLEYGRGPSGLPFPMKCLRVSYPLRENSPFSSLWTTVTKLESSEALTDADFQLPVRQGERVVLEDSGIGVRIPHDSNLNFESMEIIEKEVFEKIANQSRSQELSARQIESHQTRFSFLVFANIVVFALIGFSIWYRSRRKQNRVS